MVGVFALAFAGLGLFLAGVAFAGGGERGLGIALMIGGLMGQALALKQLRALRNDAQAHSEMTDAGHGDQGAQS